MIPLFLAGNHGDHDHGEHLIDSVFSSRKPLLSFRQQKQVLKNRRSSEVLEALDGKIQGSGLRHLIVFN